jgi:hypothetical protein
MVIGAQIGCNELTLVMQTNHKEKMRKAKIEFFRGDGERRVSFFKDFGNGRN